HLGRDLVAALLRAERIDDKRERIAQNLEKLALVCETGGSDDGAGDEGIELGFDSDAPLEQSSYCRQEFHVPTSNRPNAHEPERDDRAQGSAEDGETRCRDRLTPAIGDARDKRVRGECR